MTSTYIKSPSFFSLEKESAGGTVNSFCIFTTEISQWLKRRSYSAKLGRANDDNQNYKYLVKLKEKDHSQSLQFLDDHISPFKCT